MPKIFRLFTLPECVLCREAKAVLIEAKVPFQTVDLEDSEGLAGFRRIYKEIKDRLPRDDQGTMPVPVLVIDDGERIVDVASGGVGAIRECLSRA